MRRKLFIGLILLVFVVVITLLIMFCVNPPIPETVINEELQLDHVNKCLKLR